MLPAITACGRSLLHRKRLDLKIPKMPDEYLRETLAEMPPAMAPMFPVVESAFYAGVCSTLIFIRSLQTDYTTDKEKAAAYMMFDQRVDEIRAQMEQRRTNAAQKEA
jgi:hypothetical protein